MIKDYFDAIFAAFLSDPPDSDYQRGYLAAMVEASKALIQMDVPIEVEDFTKEPKP